MCAGCFRTLQEIAAWAVMEEEQRLQVMNDVLPERRARQEE